MDKNLLSVLLSPGCPQESEDEYTYTYTYEDEEEEGEAALQEKPATPDTLVQVILMLIMILMLKLFVSYYIIPISNSQGLSE